MGLLTFIVNLVYILSMNHRNYDNLLTLYFSCIEGFKKFESTPRDFGTGQELHGSEIHTLQMIGKNEHCNLTQLAKRLGISKSGLSKFTKKLLEKGLIDKKKDKSNGKEVFFTLTEKGYIAYSTHEEFDRKMFSSIFSLLDSYNKGELDLLEGFLGNLSILLSELNRDS